MVIRRYHIVYQEGKEYAINQPFDWFKGPLDYDAGWNLTQVLNQQEDGRIYMLVYDKINMFPG